MTIIRADHNAQNPFVQIHKATIEDPNLSWAAKGLWTYLMSRPNNWQIHVSQLARIYQGPGKKGGGETAIWSLLNELIENGYCERFTKKAEKGRFGGVEYVISELKKTVPHRGKPDPVQPDPVKVGNNKNEVYNNNDLDKDKKTTTSSKKDDDVSSSEEKIQKMATYLKQISDKWGIKWRLDRAFLRKLVAQHGIEFVAQQLNYMCDQEKKAISDERSMKERKTPRVDIPGIYLKMACEKNWAYSNCLED